MIRTAKYLYLIGGCALVAEREPIKQIEKFHVEEMERFHVKIIAETCGELEMARRSPACFLKGKEEILIVGGCLGPDHHTETMEIYTISERVSKMQQNSNLEIGASCSAFDTYTTSKFKPIFGGFEAHSCLDDVQVLKESSSKWKCHKLPKRIPKIKNATVLEVKPGEFWIFGGWEDEQRTTKAIRKINFNDEFTDYTVDFHGFLPYPVEGHSCTRIGSDVYLIGGFDGISVIDTIIKYNLDTKKSEILPIKLNERRENHVSAVLSGRFLVVAGGWNSKSSLSHVEVFEQMEDGSLERCQVEGQLKFARNRPAGVAI